MTDEPSSGPARARMPAGSWRWGVGALGTAAVVGAVTVVPHLLTDGGAGTGHAAARRACPPQFAFFAKDDLPTRPGAAARLVPGEPGAAVICRYRISTKGDPAHDPARLIGSHPLPDVRSYANRANRLPVERDGTFGCMSYGEPLGDLVLFSYGDDRVQGLSINESCGLVMNGRRAAKADRGFVGLVDALIPSPAPPRPSAVTTSPPSPVPRPTPLTRDQLRAVGCAPHVNAPTPVRPDPSVQAATNQVWARIETWLRAHAPATYATLGPPADPRRIAAAQTRLGVRFPDDVVVSLLRHNGVRQQAKGAFEVPMMFRLLSLDGIESTWRMLCGVVRDMGDTSRSWWHGGLVPIGDDGTGVTLVAAPEYAGRVGNADDEQGLIFDSPDGWPSYLALLQATASALESGRPVRGSYPRTDGSGVLTWAYRPSHS